MPITGGTGRVPCLATMAPARASGALNANVTNRHYAWPVDGRDAEVAATSTLDDLHRVIRNRLKRIQYRPELIDGFLAQTGLTLNGAA